MTIDVATLKAKFQSGKSQSKPEPKIAVVGSVPNQDKADDDPDLIEMNEKFAVVKIGGKTRIMSLEENPLFPGTKEPVFQTVADFKAFHLKRKKNIGEGKKEIGIGHWWFEHAGRQQYEGVVYDPGGKTANTFNLWQGFSCKPNPVGSCDLYLKHLLENVCAGNAQYYEYLINWIARAVQYPGQTGEVAVVMRGKEGTGKGVAAKEYGRLFGSHFRHVVHAGHLVGHFNSHLQHCSALFADEAFFAGDKSHESVLKALITEETLLIEPKGMDVYPVRNCIHLMLSSNADWVVPAGAEARRYFVLNVADTNMQDTKYFGAIVHQMENGGRAALLDFLQRRDLSQFNVRAVPLTEALAEQKAHSRRGIDRLVENIAHSGVLPSSHPLHPNVAVTSGEEKEEGFYCAARRLAPDLRHSGSRVITMALRNHWGCKSWKSGYQRGIEFPPLAELRALFDRRHGAQEWFAEISDWEGPLNA
jgi:Family of unknown function (DUF5906)